VLEGLACIMSEYLEEVNSDALAEEIPSLGGSLSMSDSMDIFPRRTSHFGLDYLLPWLPGFVRKKNSIEFESLHSFHGEDELRSFNCLYGIFVVRVGDR
jgi:hypothetical protein